MTLFIKRMIDETHSLFYYKGSKECDFVKSRGGDVEHLIQVSWDISDKETMARETAGIIKAAETTGCNSLWLITIEEEKEISTAVGTIHVVPAWKWMLTFKL